MDRNTDIHTRETQRRRVLWRLAGLQPGDPAALELILALDEIDRAEADDASLVTKILDAEELLVQVLAEDHACGFTIVRHQNIPQPWRSRFLAASIGSTRVVEGFYAHDWHSFLRRWQAEMIHLDSHRSAGMKSTS
ncbi:hypothetical protein [Pseudomonas japonica]|uniref:hypothetical protein n=1 Tax=Pseudomonas japonica TaxID=256466 RepID=UPI0015E489D2|nr:hypothetical protein [Pseudomonas japonica]MBA1245716.1 hypothetical protein [Pseudomonas japonica]